MRCPTAPLMLSGMPQGGAEEMTLLKAGSCASSPRESALGSQSEASPNDQESAQTRENSSSSMSSGEKLGVELPDRIEIFAPCGGGTTQGETDVCHGDV